MQPTPDAAEYERRRRRTCYSVTAAVMIVLLLFAVALAAYSAWHSTALRNELEHARHRRHNDLEAVDAETRRDEAIAVARTLHFIINHEDDPAALATLRLDSDAR